MLWAAWLPVVLIGVFHYATGAHHHWVHDVLRRLYYVPILLAAFSNGVRGGLLIAVVASLTYAPHAFLLMDHSMDPATTLNKVLEILLYNTIGIVAGVLADREAGRRQQAERAFARQREMAEQLVRAGRLAALGELVAGIAHEIKNPLHTLKGTAEIVHEVVPPEAEQYPMWTVHRQEIGRLERIAERFLSFARPAQPDLIQQPFGDIFERVKELIHAQGHQAAGVKIDVAQLETRVAEALVRADPDQVAQVALNVSSNAFKAMSNEGRLRVEGALTVQGDVRYVVLRICNDGPAILEEDLERVFDPFCTRSAEGTGLGLSISERIAEAHGGFMRVENTQPGVAFSLLLPIV
jgi:signal transduction histidine kinase